MSLLKKSISILIVAQMLMSCLLLAPIIANADDDDTYYVNGNSYPVLKYDDFRYYVSGENVNIVDYVGKDSKVVIPETIDGKKVTHLTSNEVSGLPKSVTSVSIPQYVTKIDVYCGMTSFDGQYYILQSFFENEGSGGKNLKKITVNKNNKKYTSLNGVLFDKKKKTLICYPKAKSNKSYKIPSSVRTIGNGAFAKTKVSKVILPKKLKTIGAFAFSESSIINMKMPNSVKKVGSGTFVSCRKLKSVKLSKKMTLIPSCMISNVKKLKKISIPNRVKKINECGIFNCKNLKKVTLGKKLKTIDYDVLSECPKLKSITVPKSVTKIEYSLGMNMDGESVKGFKIYGKKGSAAQKYAKKFKIKFVKI